MVVLDAEFYILIERVPCAGTGAKPARDPTKSATIEIQVSAPQEQQKQVTGDESGEDAQIAPPVVETQFKGTVELIADLVRTVLAQIGRIVDDVSRTPILKELGHI